MLFWKRSLLTAAEKINTFKNLQALVLRLGDEDLTVFFASYLNASPSLQVKKIS